MFVCEKKTRLGPRMRLFLAEMGIGGARGCTDAAWASVASVRAMPRAEQHRWMHALRKARPGSTHDFVYCHVIPVIGNALESE